MGRRPLGDLNPNNYNRALDIRGPAQISNSDVTASWRSHLVSMKRGLVSSSGR
jgi:hypothetical protein